MSTTPAPMVGPAAAARHAIREYSATRQDLMHVGYSGYRTRRLRRDTAPRSLGRVESVAVPLGGVPSVAALVPVSELALRIAKFGAYLRSEELALPVHLRASHIGWAQKGRVCVVRPILARYRIGSFEAIPSIGAANASQLAGAPHIDEWSGPAALFFLGDEEPLSVDLGYKPNRGGGVQGIAGTRHYLLEDLREADRVDARLVDLKTV